MNSRITSVRGFTLIEVLVVMVIFSVLMVLGYMGFERMVDVDARSRQQVAEQNQLHYSWSVLINDFLQLRARPVRDQLGDPQAAYQVEVDDYAVRFTRGGLPLGVDSSGGLQRVAYRVNEKGELERWVWPVLDQLVDNQPIAQPLMGGVSSIRFEQLDLENNYQLLWPPLNTNLSLQALPRMVRITLTLADGSELMRLVPGVDLPEFENAFPAYGSGDGTAPEGGGPDGSDNAPANPDANGGSRADDSKDVSADVSADEGANND